MIIFYYLLLVGVFSFLLGSLIIFLDEYVFESPKGYNAQDGKWVAYLISTVIVVAFSYILE